MTNAEDLVAIDGGRWLVASSITSRGEPVGAGRLYLVDAATRTAEELFPGAEPVLRRDAATYGNCSIELGAFDTHGLDLVVLNATELLMQAPVILLYGYALGQQIAI